MGQISVIELLICLIAIVVIAIVVMAIQAIKNKNKASGNISFGLLIGLFFCSILLLVVGPVLVLPLFIERIEDIVAQSKEHMGAVLFFTGILSFAISLLIMSFFTYFSSSANNEQRVKSLFRLDRKEIRRSIAISFTILYIMIIAFFFQEAASVSKSLAAISNELGMGTPMNTSMIAAMNTTLTAKGITPLSNGLSAFTTVYLVIIGFYFGSRVYEKIKEIKDADEVLKIQYIMDEISEEDFDKKMEKLQRKVIPNSQLEITEIASAENKITIKHQGGENINLKDIRIIINVEKEEQIEASENAQKTNGNNKNVNMIESHANSKLKSSTRFDLVMDNRKEDGEEPKLTVFGVKDEMVITMKKKNNDACLAITVKGKPIVVTNNSCDNIGEGFMCNVDTTVEVSVIYKPTKEIIAEKKFGGKIVNQK